MYMFVPGVCAPVRLPARSEFNRHRKSPRAARPGDFFHLLAPSRRSAFFPDASSGGKGGTLARFPAGSGRRAVPNAVLDRPAVLSHDPAEGFASRYGIHGDAIGRFDRRDSFPAVRRRSRSAASRIPGAPDRGRQLTEDPRPAAARGTLREGGAPLSWFPPPAENVGSFFQQRIPQKRILSRSECHRPGCAGARHPGGVTMAPPMGSPCGLPRPNVPRCIPAKTL